VLKLFESSGTQKAFGKYELKIEIPRKSSGKLISEAGSKARLDV